MNRSIKRLVMALASVATSVGLCMPAQAGQGGSSGGMSRGSFSGGASRSMGSSMRSNMGGSMSARSFSSQPRNFSRPSRSMNSPSFNQRNSISGGAVRNFGGSVQRNVGGSSFGGVRSPLGSAGNNMRAVPRTGSFNNRQPVTTTRPNLGRQVGKQLDSRLTKPFDRGVVKDLGKSKLGNVVGRGTARDLGKGKLGDVVGRGVVKDLGRAKLGDLSRDRVSRDRVSDLLGGKLGSKSSPIVNGARIADGLKSGRIRTGDLAKIDRSKLRDLVRGVEGGKGVIGKGGLKGGIPKDGIKNGGFGGFDKVKIADVIHNGGLKPFHPTDMLGGKLAAHKSGVAGILAGGCFPTHHDHHHHHGGHWFDFGFGGSWWDHCYDYPSYGHYDHCHYDYGWYPTYTYPTCGITLAAYPEVVTLAGTDPIFIDQTINLELPQDESAAEPVAEEPTLEVAALAGDSLAETATEEPAEEGNDASDADELQTEDAVTDAADADPVTDVATTEPAEQPELDLELIDVEMVAAGSREANEGPSFKVTVRNAGKRDMEKFLVSLVACKDVQIDSSSIHGSATIDTLAAGVETSVKVTLPVEALSLNRDDQGRSTPFNTLVAAVDSDERMSEGNEENNLALIDRTSIKLAGF